MESDRSSSKSVVVLAYSGGLDTSCILVWLIEKGYEVVAFMADVGQKEDFREAKAKAEKLGAKKVVVQDLRRPFVEEFVWAAVGAGALYEGRYLLGTALARPCIARALVAAARDEGAACVAHGATGKGNDQLRFELGCRALDPRLQVIAPWRLPEFYERFRGRQDLMRYAEEKGIPVSATPRAPWSTDENLAHISYESGVLEDPWVAPPPGLFQRSRDPRDASDVPDTLEIDFEDGIPKEVRHPERGVSKSDPLELYEYLDRLGAEHGVGRIDIVENRVVGIKSRGVYESPASTILHEAHRDLEIFVLDKEVLTLKTYLSNHFSELVYKGLWFSPEAEFVRACLALGRGAVRGSVRVRLYRGGVAVLGRRSPASPYDRELASMDVQGDYSPADVEGFIRISAVRLREHYRLAGVSPK